MNNVTVWEESVMIPTYPVGKPEKNPIFLEKRVYQGSSGAVYPYPVIETIGNEKEERTYRGLFLENQYLKIMILPELGGRVQMAFDKIRNRHFVYHNRVIKPALVGLTGPWISGGIEFNWPQHHRPSTFERVDADIATNPDGSATIWVNEIERMSRTKGMAGFTLYPDKAYLEIKVRLYNRSAFPQSFLWWANPAVAVNESYQSVFPPDVYAVYDHGKRDVSSFPIATGTYYKKDYSPGTDISWYKNIPVPTSYMAVGSQYDFLGGYEHDTQAGLLHVANHHVSPGKKQWTWGNGAFGQAWDRNLTDDDGPYIELMTGCFTDNQPDFSWLMPGEEKAFEQYFMPYHSVGMVKNATKDVLLNLEATDGQVTVWVYVTASQPGLRVLLEAGTPTGVGTLLLDEQMNLDPHRAFRRTVPLGDTALIDLHLRVLNGAGTLLVEYQPLVPAQPNPPAPAEAAPLPQDCPSTEELYLIGLHLEQYRHATFRPDDYYREALRRDPFDSRNNNALGLWLLRNGQIKAAEPHFRRAVARLTQRNANPYDSEALCHLGRCLFFQERHAEAFGLFYKATWSEACRSTAFFALAQLATLDGRFGEGLSLVENALNSNARHHRARHLKAVLLRRLERIGEAADWIAASLALDGFNVGCHYERYRLTGDEADLIQVHRLLAGNWHSYAEYALDYGWAGQYADALALLSSADGHLDVPNAMLPYYQGWLAHRAGLSDEAHAYFAVAAQASPDYCFPNQLEAVPALTCALHYNPADAKATYYLGLFWYAKRQLTEAVTCWEQSRRADDTFPTVHRNLALAYYKQDQPARAVGALERAFALDPTDARVAMELHQLYKRRNVPLTTRLAFLEQHLPLTLSRDDLYLERVALYNDLDQPDTALQLLLAHRFHPWEGGEGRVTGEYLRCRLSLARQALKRGHCADALTQLDATATYPFTLGEGKLDGARENDIDFFRAMAYQGLGDPQRAQRYLDRAATGPTEFGLALYYNDQQPDKLFYQALALLHRGNLDDGMRLLTDLTAYGQAHQHDEVRIDYFAVSLPDMLLFDEDLSVLNRLHCQYLMGLGALGHGHWDEAQAQFDAVLAANNSHAGALTHRAWLDCEWARALIAPAVNSEELVK